MVFSASIRASGPTAPAKPAQDLPIFDAHIHYSRADWSVYSPEAALGILDAAGIRWALVSSTPDAGRLRLYEKAPTRIVPFLRPYRTQADMATWTDDPSVLSYVEARLQRGIYKGVGEFHLPVGRAGSAVVYGFMRLALRSDVARGGRLDPAWRDLFLEHPDRFMVGTDTWVTSQWSRLPEIQIGIRAWLRQLPPDVAERIAFKNGTRLVGMP